MTSQEQMASDIHVIAAPFRFVGGMLRTAALIVLALVLMVGGVVYAVTTGKSPLSQDELGMITSFFKLALILSVVWLPFMFVGPHVRKVGYCALGSLALFALFLFSPSPSNWQDHEFTLTFAQLAIMLFLPPVIVVLLHLATYRREEPNPKVQAILRTMHEARFPADHPLAGQLERKYSQKKLVRITDEFMRKNPDAPFTQRIEAAQRRNYIADGLISPSTDRQTFLLIRDKHLRELDEAIDSF